MTPNPNRSQCPCSPPGFEQIVLISTWTGLSQKSGKRESSLLPAKVLCSSCPLGIHRSNELTEVRDFTWKTRSLHSATTMSGRWWTPVSLGLVT
ncbi:hypothetical protein TNIN_98341 [Trichonephila inaurata madagascariensis]|uniref:Uncharacterized protein n=1 Tax=Trichonephila inaurata madagascariensis TaxID=2747483 RepID=A0A8X6Y7T9_9ARAC|nr:hypothetical protein TNIN_98341 [Trichonephila inaurata madagascariensis]